MLINLVKKICIPASFEQFQDMSTLSNDRFHQPKQTRPPRRSPQGFDRNEYRRVHRQKHQVLFTEALRVVVQEKIQFSPKSTESEKENFV